MQSPDDLKKYQIDLFTFVAGKRSHTQRFVAECSSAEEAEAWGDNEAKELGHLTGEYELELEVLEPEPVVENPEEVAEE